MAGGESVGGLSSDSPFSPGICMWPRAGPDQTGVSLGNQGPGALSVGDVSWGDKRPSLNRECAGEGHFGERRL